MPVDHDLMNPPASYEAKLHKFKRLVPKPNSYFMDVKCHGCFEITVVYSHATSVVFCSGCSQVIAQPTGGKARIADGCAVRVRAE